jgi:chromosome segregation ATPase
MAKWDEKKYLWKFAVKRRKVLLQRMFEKLKHEEEKNAERAAEIESLLRQERKKLEKEVKSLITSAQDQVNDLQKNLRKLKKEKEKADADIKKLNEELQNERSQEKLLEEECAKYSKEVDQLKEQLVMAQVR